jgi:hypothetical protein
MAYGTDSEYLEQNMQTVWSLVDQVPNLKETLIASLEARRSTYTSILKPIGMVPKILDVITAFDTKRLPPSVTTPTA